MADGEYWWLIYLVFLAIPLARIVPRIISRGRARDVDDGSNSPRAAHDYVHERGIKGRHDGSGPRGARGPAHDGDARGADDRRAQPDGGTGTSSEMAVMGSMYRGATTFEAIQKKTAMDAAVLERTLERLEEQGMIRVVQKQGLFGTRVELRPTGKGFGRDRA